MYMGNENDGHISALVYRSGDISYRSTVRCYTRQGSAQVMMDFNERPNTDDSIITFLPGNNTTSTKSHESQLSATQADCKRLKGATDFCELYSTAPGVY